MIPLEQVQRYLGHVQGTDPFALLGLTPESFSPARLEEALRSRIARTYASAHGSSVEAEEVRRALRAAAAVLRNPARRDAYAAQSGASTHAIVPNPTRLHSHAQLTQFDREVMAILVASGGWNPLSRARLVALAGAHGVTARGLIRVIAGLSEYARTGGPRLAMSQIASAQPRMGDAAFSDRGALAHIAQVTVALVEKFSPELREQNTRATVALSAFFGTIAMVASIMVWFVLVAPMFETTQVATHESPPVVPVAPFAQNDEDAFAEEEAEPASIVADHEPIRFDAWPTFRAPLPEKVAEAQRRARDLPDELEALSRRLVVSDEPSEAVFHLWEAAISDIGEAWVMLDPEFRSDIEQRMVDVLFVASDSFPTLDRLMRKIQPDEWDYQDPLTLWRGAWQVGMLAELARSRLLPPAVVDQAGTHLRLALRRVDAEHDHNEPSAVRAVWLDAVRDRIVTEWEEEDRLIHWECWLAARRDGTDDESYRHAVTRTIKAVLDAMATPIEQPSGADPRVRLLGRLIEALDFEASPATKSELLALFEDSDVGSDALHLLTCLLAHPSQVEWFVDGFVVPPSADDRLRRRMADQIASAWPDLSEIKERLHLAAAGLKVDSYVLDQWNELRQRVEGYDRLDSDEGLMFALVLQTRLNEAAMHLSQGATGRAERALVSCESLLERDDRARTGGRGTTTDPHGRAAGSSRAGAAPVSRAGPHDDHWVQRYRDAGRDVNKRLDLLAELRRRSSGDLSESAASVFVREVYRGSPREVRDQARTILVDRLSRGRTVAMEMLDQFVDVARSPITGEMISSYTGHSLPHVRSGEWRRDARRALVEHAIELHVPDRPTIDVLASELAESVHNQAAALVDNPESLSQPLRPKDAIAQLYVASRDRARNVEVSGRAIPASISDIAQRHQTRVHFAHHSIHDYLAHQISVLELSAYTAAAQQAALVPVIETLLAEAAHDRQEALHVLNQALSIERAITSLWQIRFDPGVHAHMPSVELHDLPAGIQRQDRAAQHDAHKWNDKVAGVERWTAQLVALHPDEPEAYLILAEDVADRAASDEEMALARHLFGLAGIIDRGQFGASAALALAEFADRELQRERLRALAKLLDPVALEGTTTLHEPAAPVAALQVDHDAALSAAYALSAYRLGDGRELRNLLDGPGGALLVELGDALPGGTAALREATRDWRGGRISISQSRLERMLRLELALLSDGGRSWSGELLLGGTSPLLEIDPMRLEKMFGVDASRPYFRNGRWVERALPVRR